MINTSFNMRQLTSMLLAGFIVLASPVRLYFPTDGRNERTTRSSGTSRASRPCWASRSDGSGAHKEGREGKGGPTDRTTLLRDVNGHIDSIYKELDVQLKRIAQIQQEVDELREKVKKLSD